MSLPHLPICDNVTLFKCKLYQQIRPAHISTNKNKHLCTFKLRNVFIHFTYYFSARHGLTNNDSSRGRWMFKKKKSERYRPNRNSNNGAAANSNGAGNNTNLNSATNSDDNERNCMLNHVSNSFCCLCSTPNYV